MVLPVSMPLKEELDFHRVVASVLWQLCEEAGIEDCSRRSGFFWSLVKGGDRARSFIALGLRKILASSAEPLPGMLGRWIREGRFEFAVDSIQHTISHSDDTEGMARMRLLTQWAEYGFPSYTLGHKLAASLLVTRLSKDVLENVNLPFPAVEVILPTDMFQVTRNGGHESVGQMLGGGFRSSSDISEETPIYGLLIQSQSRSLYTVKNSLGDLSRLQGTPEDPYSSAKILPQDERVALELARLLCNLALLMTDSSNYKTIGKGHDRSYPASSGNRRRVPWPVRRVYQLTTPVRHDFREAVDGYLKHGSSRLLTVQSSRRWVLEARQFAVIDGPEQYKRALEDASTRTGARGTQAYLDRTLLARPRRRAHRASPPQAMKTRRRTVRERTSTNRAWRAYGWRDGPRLGYAFCLAAAGVREFERKIWFARACKYDGHGPDSLHS